MKHIITTLLIFTCAVAFTGCKDSSELPEQPPDAEPNVPEPNVPELNEPPSTDIPAAPPANTFEITGTVVYKNLEGGFFAIDSDDGKKYDPISLPQNYRRDGLKVKVTARLKPDAVSFHMYGPIIEVISITAQ
jgi:hypothetical protein